MIDKAKQFAELAHKGQIRKFNGEPYVNHPIRVAEIIKGLQVNPDLICAALLHDVVEDTEYKVRYEVFNEVIAAIVSELTNKYTKEQYPDLNRQERHEAEADRLAECSWSARLIKLADRFDNLRDFKRDDPDFGPHYYYVKESYYLVDQIADTSLAHQLLVTNIYGVIDD